MIIAVLLAALLAAFVQSVAGFGFALLAVPVMAITLDPHLAVVVSTMLGIVTTTAQATQDRRHVDAVLTRRLVLSSVVGMPVGLLIFLTADVRVLRVVLGACVLCAVVLLARRLDLAHAGPRMDVALGSMSGVLATSLSTNGPPLVFDLQARGLPPERFRATLSAVLAAAGLMSLAVFAAAGQVEGRAVVAGAVALPALLLGYLVGRWVRPRLHGDRFRVVVLILLTIAALGSVGSGVFG